MSSFEGIVALRHQIIRPLTEQNIVPIDDLVVVGSAVMQFYGIKPAPDIDVVVPHGSLPEGRSDLCADESGWEFTQLPRVQGELPIHYKYPFEREGDPYPVDYDELFSEADVVDTPGGLLRISPLRRIRAWKEAVGREKDRRDVELIDAYWATQPRMV